VSKSISIAPANSLLFISDPDGGETPEISRGTRLWSTRSCIAVGCYPFMDGPTTVTIGPSDEVGTDKPATFVAQLATPNRRVIVSTSEREVLLEADTRGPNTKVMIWTNDPLTPDSVIVGID
jgi:hypothetical protein